VDDIPRRTLPELAFIYEREPDRRDIYVEGPFDASVVSWFTHECSINGVAVYPISSVEIPDDELRAIGQRPNNRESVCYLACFLATSHARRALCIVDADFTIIRGSKVPDPPLFQTDYACMEMYFFNPSSFTKFFALCCHRSDWPTGAIMDALVYVLQEFFLYRCANDDLGWEMTWLEKPVCVTLNAWRIDFDSNEFVLRLLNKNSRAADKAEFLKHVDQLRKRLTAEPRHQMNGHDFTALLAWYLRQKGIRGPRSQLENVVACMTLTLDHESLKKEPMFQSLSAYLS
jgi:hypothetical protein